MASAAPGNVGTRERHRLDTRLPGSRRRPPAAGQQPPGGHLRRAPGRRRRRLRGRGGLVGGRRPAGPLRVPGGGRRAHRAQVPAPAARQWRRRARRGARGLGGARPPTGPAARVSGLRGGRRRVRPAHRAGRPLGAPHRRTGPRPGGPGPRPAGGGHPGPGGGGLHAGDSRATGPGRRPLPRDGGRRDGGRRGGRTGPAPAPDGARHLPGADRPPDVADRDHRALPGAPGAVQAGAGLAGPGPHVRRPGRRVGARCPRIRVRRAWARPTSTRAERCPCRPRPGPSRPS